MRSIALDAVAGGRYASRPNLPGALPILLRFERCGPDFPRRGYVSKTINAGGLLLLAAVGGWFLLKNFDVQGLDQIRLTPKSEQATPAGDDGQPRRTDSVRIATFNIQVFGEEKLRNAKVMNILAEAVRNFDVVAIQEVRALNQGVLPEFVDQINAAGRQYDFAIGPRLGRTTSKEQYAFVFDTETIEMDRSSLYTVRDDDDLLHREPLVAGFRARGAPPDQAFTFTLVNIHTDPDEVDTEVDALADVFRAVRADGREEDDIILLGDLNADEQHLGALGQITGISVAIAGTPTNTRANKQYDNLVFHLPSTSEFSGRAGVLDLMGQYNLTLEQALEVSDHLPVWGEFSVYEGGQAGRLAAQERTAR
jgi:endonuclease/exonuclease/phosphatase family metal-dependent hydrolase